MATYAGKGALSNGSVYICNLPFGTDENMLAEYFGTIGLLKVRSLATILFTLFHFLYTLDFAFIVLIITVGHFLLNLQRKTSEQVDRKSGCIVINRRMSLKEMLL